MESNWIVFCTMIKINGNENIRSNICAFECIKINGYTFILNAWNKDKILFHPYLGIKTKSNLCKFNVFTWPQSTQIITNYLLDKHQPFIWLTKPIPIFTLSPNAINYLMAWQMK